jgi:cytochrome P450
VATEPVRSWVDDYDIFDPEYVLDPYPIWQDLRGECPVAHSDRWGGSHLPTRYEDVKAVAHDVEHFSSTEVTVTPPPADQAPSNIKAPPITSDPPEHHWARRLILPAFAPKAVERHEPYTRELCGRLIDGFLADGRTDAAANYAQQIPPRVIAHMLGIPETMSDEFTEWVRGVLELGLADPVVRLKYRDKIIEYFTQCVEERKAEPTDDFITEMLQSEVDGAPVPDHHVIGTCNLLLIAGIDTTWSSIGSALWHLASHPEDTARLVAEPELMPNAVEELLRAYSPVTMARIATDDTDIGGCPVMSGERVLLNFPGANRDPEMFERADEVVIDRQVNRHIAFGVGIHRCAGSNLARMEMLVALEEWLARIPEFRLADPSAVTWAGGQVRGPRQLPVLF